MEKPWTGKLEVSSPTRPLPPSHRSLPLAGLTFFLYRQTWLFLYHRLLQGAKEVTRLETSGMETPGGGEVPGVGEGTNCQTRRLQEAGRGALRRMLGCSPSPSSPLRGLCHQGYPLPSPGWRQPARQRPHCQLVHISSAWRERSKGASERETEPKGTCPPTQADFTSPPGPPPRLHQPAQARGQAPLLGGGRVGSGALWCGLGR